MPRIFAEQRVGDEMALALGRRHYVRLSRADLFVLITDEYLAQVDARWAEIGARFMFARYAPNPIYIGRAVPPEVGMRIESGYLSKLHAKVWRTASSLFVSDRKSANGTFLVVLEMDSGTYPLISDGEMGRMRARRTYEFRGYVVSGPAGEEKAPRFFVDESQTSFERGRVLMECMPRPRVEISRAPADIAHYRVVVYYRTSTPGAPEQEALEEIHDEAASLYTAPGQGRLAPREIRFEFSPSPPNEHLPPITDREAAIKLVRFLRTQLSAGAPFAPTIEQAALLLQRGFIEGTTP